jgi:RNA polymerase sigma-70 factor, ECF subfamily
MRTIGVVGKDSVVTADEASANESLISEDDLEVLARRAADGDREALDLLLAAIRPRVLRHCRRLLPFHDDAEDACQDALVRVNERIHTFAGRSLFVTWLFQVTANSSRDTYRRLRRASEHQVAEPLERPDPRTTSVIAGSRIDLLEALDELERNHPALVTPFVLRDMYDLPYADIADHLDTPLGTVKRRIHDARDWMRSALKTH